MKKIIENALAMTNSTWRGKNSLNQLIHTHRWRHCRLHTKVNALITLPNSVRVQRL